MKKRKLKKQNKQLRSKLGMTTHLLAEARHALFESANEKLAALNAITDVWNLDREKLGQQAKQRLFAAITLLGGNVKP